MTRDLCSKTPHNGQPQNITSTAEVKSKREEGGEDEIGPSSDPRNLRHPFEEWDVKEQNDRRLTREALHQMMDDEETDPKEFEKLFTCIVDGKGLLDQRMLIKWYEAWQWQQRSREESFKQEIHDINQRLRLSGIPQVSNSSVQTQLDGTETGILINLRVIVL